MWLSINYLLGLGTWLAALAMALVVLVRWRQQRRLSKRTLRRAHWGLACWIFLVALTMPEIACALFYDTTDAFSQSNVSRRWYERHVHPNRKGYRDSHELPTVRVEGKQYVGFVGDSFTFGHGVKNVADRFTDRIAAALAGENVVVSNMALPGLEIRDIVHGLLPEFSREETPIDVLVYTFVPNDIECFDARTADFYQRLARRNPSNFLLRNTYFYNLLYYRLQPQRSADGGDYYSFLATAYAGEPWKLFGKKLNTLQAWCRANHIELQVVIFPFLTTLGNHDPFAPAYAAMESHCREHGIPCIDLTATMTAHRDEGLVVSRFDSHPNARAHALAAEAMLPEIRKRIREHEKD